MAVETDKDDTVVVDTRSVSKYLKLSFVDGELWMDISTPHSVVVCC